MQASTQKVELDGNWKLVLFTPLQPRIINVSCLQSLKMTHRKTPTSYICTVCNQKWKQNLQILTALEKIVECLRVARAIVPWCLSQILIKTKTSFVFHINDKVARGCDWLWHSHSSLALFHQVLGGKRDGKIGARQSVGANDGRTSSDQPLRRGIHAPGGAAGAPPPAPWSWAMKKLCRKTQSSEVKHGETPSFTIFPWYLNVDYLIHISADYFSKFTVTFKRDDLLHRLHLHVLDSHREVHLDFSLHWKEPRCQGKLALFRLQIFSWLGYGYRNWSKPNGAKGRKDNVRNGNESNNYSQLASMA